MHKVYAVVPRDMFKLYRTVPKMWQTVIKSERLKLDFIFDLFRSCIGSFSLISLFRYVSNSFSCLTKQCVFLFHILT